VEAYGSDPELILTYDDAAEKIWKAKTVQYMVNMDNLTAKGILAGALWSRSGENMSKLAVIKVCSDGRQRISAKDMNWAGELVEYLTEQTVNMIAERISENEHEAGIKKILRFVKSSKHPEGLVSRRQITRAHRGMKADDIEKILNRLISEGDLEPGKEGTKGRTANVFTAKVKGQKFGQKDRS
jgi:hypothetical protein